MRHTLTNLSLVLKSLTSSFSRRVSLAALLLAVSGSIVMMIVRADNTAQTLPFSQNWTNTGLITANDNWSGVAGIEGYLGQDITTATGADPQTLLTTSAVANDLDVIANQANPNTQTSGGVAEFDGIANPTIALQGSGTADAPYVLIHLNTSGLTSINVAYNLRDIDGSADNAVQPVALQYRVGNSGNFTNLPAGFVADATTGPSLATLVTPVSVTLPAAANNQPLVQVRIITANAAGSDEWVGVDDISITGQMTGLPTNPTGTGLANPATIVAGNSTLLTVAVNPGGNPTSTGLAVTADLTMIGGSATQTLFDNGTNGDVTSGDNIFSYSAAVPANTTAGGKTLPFSITDAQARSGSGSISLTVQAPPPPSDHVVISQIYGGGGNSGATYQNDYVELYNPSAMTFNLNGWSVQYASSTSSFGVPGTITPLAGSITPGQYYLVKLASGGAVGAALQPANVEGATNISATAGKIALVNNSDPLSDGSSPCTLGDPNLVDFVGFGAAANCREGSANAPAGSNTAAILRNSNGAADTNQNAADFTAGAPNPRRTATIVDAPPFVSSTDTDADAFASTPAPRDASIAVFFSEPVVVIGTWYSLTCVSTGAHTTVAAAGPQNWVITPDVNFQPGEQCTFQIFAANVKDADLDDSVPNTDFMQADYTTTFTVASDAVAPYDPSVHLTMGNPSNAVTDINQPNNYLLLKPEYTVSYNRDRGGPNWVSWHLADDWTGSLTRVDTFRPDPQLPAAWNRVNQFDYSGSGFDRGHMTPSADRLASLPLNQATFLMDNIIPQAPDNNQITWNNMEQALRAYTPANELYIISGGAGIGGSGDNGPANTIAGGRITVPAYTWKVALVIPKGTNDIARVDCSTRSIAVIVPNTNGTNSDWTTYLTTVDAVEALTGYDFFSNLPIPIQRCVEAGINGVNPPLDTDGDGVSDVNDLCPNTPPNTPVNASGCPLPSAPCPVISAVANVAITPVTLTATGGTGSPYTFSATGLPTGLTISTGGTISGTTALTGTFPYTVTVRDKDLNPGTVNCSVTVAAACPTISVTPSSIPTGTAGSVYGPVQFLQTGGVTPITWSVSSNNLLAGLTLNPSTGQLSGTPTVAGGVNITIRATDSSNCFGETIVTLQISCPTITISPSSGSPTALTSGTVGQSYSQTFTAAPAGGGITYSIPMAAIPPGLTFNTSTAVLSGTPTTQGTFFFTVTATGFGTCTGSQNYSLKIDPGCPSSFTVNDVGDAPDQTPGDKLCQAASGACTLRAAIMEANAIPACTPLTINFSVTGTINLATALPALDHPNLTINGPGANQLDVHRNAVAPFRIFTINNGKTVAISGMSITNGNDPVQAGGIYNGGTLTLTACAISGNTSGQGGGIQSDGILTMTSCTVSNNIASDFGGGLKIFGPTTTLTNCTFSNNQANDSSAIESGTGVTLTLTNCTIVNNQAGSGAGQTGSALFANSGTVLKNTIVANNSGNNANIAGTVDTANSFNNLIGAVGTGGLTNGVNGNQVGVANANTLLAALANYGGTTNTVALLPGSPAINAGTSSGAPSADQRGIARVGNVDIGAFESRGFTLALAGGNNQSAFVNTAFANPLAVSVAASAPGEPVNGGKVAFMPPGSGASASIAGNPVTVSGGTASGIATANSIVGGPYTVAASAIGATPAISFSLTNTCQTITVTAPVVNTGTVGTAFSQTFTQSGGIGTITWSLTGQLPAGITLNPSTGVLSGTPTQPGSFLSIVVKATDANGCFGSVSYTLTINCQTINLSPASLPSVTPNLNYSQQLMQIGGIGSITWSATGSLPSGITLSSSGLLSGITNTPGSFTFTAKATDANGCMGMLTYTLLVNCLPVIVNPATIPTATINTFYNQSFSAGFDSSAAFALFSGGSTQAATSMPALPQTFIYSLTGSLPSGLSFISNFVFGNSFAGSLITGTPRESGTFNFTIKATSISNNVCMGSRDYTLVVQGVAPPATARIADPLVCTGPGNTVAVTATVTNTNATAQAANFTATLTPTLRALPGSCTANVGACQVVNASTITWAGTLAANQTVTINYLAQVNDGVPAGTQLCATSVATVGNSLPATVTACGTLNCPAAGPGLLAQANSPMNDQKPGSVLIFNIYTSSTNANQQNTRINLTNTNTNLSSFVHLFFVDGTSCSVADSILCLTPNQTTSFLASDLDPGSTGYIVAIAIDGNGCPTNFNYLIGDEYVKFATGHAANLGAESISAIAGGLPLCDSNSVTATLAFDGVSYNVVPRVLAVDNIPSRADGNDTLLILNRIGGNLATGPSTLGTIFGLLYDDSESVLSFSVTGSCQLRNSLSSTFPRTTPRFEQLIPSGRSGWMRLFSQSDIGITGAAINFNANATTSAGAFNQGHNLHVLTNTSAATYSIPVFPPGC